MSAALFYLVLRRLVDILRSEKHLEERVRELEAKVLVLQKQVEILERRSPRPRYTRIDRILLAALSRVIPRAEWSAFMVTPQTLLRWHRELVARKWTFRHKKVGRPRIDEGIEALIVRMAKDNSNWGYWRISDQLRELGIRVSKTTVKNVMIRNGIPPAPRRDGPSWAEFIGSQARFIAACDFFTVETAWLRTLYVFFVVEVGSRRVRFAGVTTNPNGGWVAQQARNLAMEGKFEDVRFLIRDRDSKFTRAFDDVLTCEGVKVIKTPVRSPKANAFAERLVGTFRREVGDRMLFLGRSHLVWVLGEYERHYNEQRPHQGLDDHRPPDPPPLHARIDPSQVRRVDVIGGVIHEYEPAAA